MKLKTKQVLAIGFSVAGALGTIGTAILSRKAAIKESLVKKKITNFDSLSKKEKFMALYKLYIPTGIVGFITLSSIIGSTIMSNKAQASLMSMALVADHGWKKYKNEVKSILGVGAHEDILKSLSKKEQTAIREHISRDENDLRELYYDEFIGYFQALPEDVMFAYAKINEILTDGLYAHPTDVFDGISIWDFISLANANIIDSDVDEEMLKEWGWTMDYLHNNFGNMWIHMKLIDEVTTDEIEPHIPYKVISWLEDPILLMTEDYEERLDLNFDSSTEDPNIEYATYEMFGLTKGPDGKLRKIKNNKEDDVYEK